MSSLRKEVYSRRHSCIEELYNNICTNLESNGVKGLIIIFF